MIISWFLSNPTQICSLKVLRQIKFPILSKFWPSSLTSASLPMLYSPFCSNPWNQYCPFNRLLVLWGSIVLTVSRHTTLHLQVLKLPSEKSSFAYDLLLIDPTEWTWSGAHSLAKAWATMSIAMWHSLKHGVLRGGSWGDKSIREENSVLQVGSTKILGVYIKFHVVKLEAADTETFGFCISI
jgi:hypothetical protein